jgi:hypothetical protein
VESTPATDTITDKILRAFRVPRLILRWRSAPLLSMPGFGLHAIGPPLTYGTEASCARLPHLACRADISHYQVTTPC